MAAPSMRITIQDFALGLAPAGINSAVKFGLSSGGQRGVLAGFTDAQAMKASHGVGPIVDSAAHLLAVAGGTVYLFPFAPAAGWSGTVGALTRSGPGPGTVTVTPAIWRKTLLRILTGGTLGTATFQISLDSGATYLSTVYTSAASVQLDHSMTAITMAAGTYVAAEVYTLNTDGTISQSGSGPAITSPAASSSPTDQYQWYVTITLAGALGVAEFRYSLDGGATLSATYQVPASGKFVIPNAGAYLLFASTFTLGDFYSDPALTASPPTVLATGDIAANMPTLLADSAEWDHVHVVNTWSSAANAATAATAAGVQMTAAQAAFRYTYAAVECPSNGITDAAIKAAFVAVSELRVLVGAGDAQLFSSLTGLTPRRNAAWPITARLALIPVGEDAGWISRGSLPGLRQIYRDENKTPGLDDARFSTLCTQIGFPGFFVTNARMMAPPGSDFQFSQHRRVMDRACRTARQALLPFLNGGVRVDSVTGKILEEDAARIEARTNAILRSVLVDTGNASGVSVLIDRNNNILSTSTLKVTIRVVPLGYMKAIEVDIAYENPALLQAA